MKYKHLFLDLDNTLLDFNKASRLAFHTVLRKYGKNSNGAYEDYKIINRQVWEQLEKGQINSVQLRKLRFQKFLEHMGWEGDGYEWNRQYLHELSLNHDYVEGARELLNELKPYFHFHIITNGLKEVQRPRLQDSGLEVISSSITISDEIGVAKPQGEFFKIAMQNAKVNDPNSILVIGDNYDSDIKGAQAFGLSSCWFNIFDQNQDQQLHDFEIKKIQELKEILK